VGQLALSGLIQAGPANPVDGAFPGGSLSEPLSLYNGTKSFGPGTGILQRDVASPAAFIALEGVPLTVTKGHTLYFKCNTPMVLQMTCDDGIGGVVVAEQNVHGLVVVEFPAANSLVLLKVKGTGRLEYLVVGNL
jgi:hypothetical protein